MDHFSGTIAPGRAATGRSGACREFKRDEAGHSLGPEQVAGKFPRIQATCLKRCHDLGRQMQELRWFQLTVLEQSILLAMWKAEQLGASAEAAIAGVLNRTTVELQQDQFAVEALVGFGYMTRRPRGGQGQSGSLFLTAQGRVEAGRLSGT